MFDNGEIDLIIEELPLGNSRFELDYIILSKMINCFVTSDKEIAQKITKTEKSKLVGAAIAQKAVELGIKKVVFDRNGYLYHGRVKSLAEGAREAGLVF